jgi:hypothetical protein
MGWLKDLFSQSPETSEAKKEEKAKKRRSREHSRKVRQREKELNGRHGARFYWGSVAFDTTQNVIRKETRRP